MSDRGSVGPSLSRRAAWQRWQMTSFDEPKVEEAPVEPAPLPDPGPDPEEVRQALREQARTEGRVQGMAEGRKQGLAAGREEGRKEGLAAGREQGYAEGLAQGREQGREEAAHLNALAANLAISLRGIEEQMGQSLITLALDIAAQVVRQQLAEQPQAMLAAVREVLHINPTPPQGALRLWIHPDDLELVRLHLADELKEGNWRVLADESIARGGCRAETPYGDIDATLQTRWRRVAASLGRSASWDDQP
ncbi:flagellar assembly protein H [Bordetella ansorpii]|uniref:Flagellar assembly protein FliH n=1 Tax=Bordetella ansorpii TaxID=288768 RepID=A0A157SL66_9BORD|nr:flagellar assembly protein FliH [Bordetella ansorpii]SAI71219.1 flagellar assembly protein H [Bordetella ansorpii]